MPVRPDCIWASISAAFFFRPDLRADGLTADESTSVGTTGGCSATASGSGALAFFLAGDFLAAAFFAGAAGGASTTGAGFSAATFLAAAFFLGAAFVVEALASSTSTLTTGATAAFLAGAFLAAAFFLALTGVFSGGSSSLMRVGKRG